MAIRVKVQEVVAAGEPFAVRLDRNSQAEKGLLSLTVGGEPRTFALKKGGPHSIAHPIVVDQPQARDIFDWGTAKDAGQELVVTATTDGAKESDNKIVSP